MHEHAPATTLPIATGGQVRDVVRRLLSQHRGRASAVATLFLAASALGLVMPACIGKIIDAVSSGAGLPVVAAWIAALAAGAIGAAVVALWAARVLTALVQDVLASLREDVFSAAMRLPVSTIDDGESSDLISRVTGDVDAVAEAGGNVAPTILSAGFAIAVSLAALMSLNPWLALAGIACLPFYVLGTRAFLRRSRIVFAQIRVREAARSQAVIDAVEGRETLTALNEQDHALDRVRSRALESIDVQIEGVRLRNRLFRWINGGEAFGLIGILLAGFVLHAGGAISVGMVTTAALVFHRLFGPIGQLIFGLDDIQRASIGLARLVGVIDLASAVPTTAPRLARPGDAGAAIELRGVSFRYPTTGRGVSEVTLRVEPRTTTALVGESGSGKSTLARLVAGHFPPSAGELRIDDAISPYYLSQELHHFRGTVSDNMRLAAPEASDAEIAAALTAVGADWALADRPETGVPLDEGRIQQVAVARALLVDPPVVVLDEATADVGLQHRAAVEAAIGALRQNRTVVLIAHRLEQARTADQIVVFAAGEVAQRGTHAELVRTDGSYRGFWLAQEGTAPSRTSTIDPQRDRPTPRRSPDTEPETP
ncbi:MULTISPECIES: ABC transporter ATP-binding protein [unclassified Leucobacter]|uniref:ABC transporter ATP-binding protein n=1 Tax=unclassified Leucobacter TaxID=2621730 RepID=UPI00165E4FC9|nr:MULTISPECIES: ABC transporter ATP-binding protein [unclassified Leucobacter]MBC9935974.1 ABC transporter ATP-binding protein [Leucobacter sp. cx-87]